MNRSVLHFVLALLGVVAVVQLGCRRTNSAPLVAEQALLVRQIQEMEELVARGRAGHVVPLDQGVIAIDQSALQELIVAVLPYETIVANRYRVRVLGGHITCNDGLAFVQLNGRMSIRGQPEERAFVEANLFGSLKGFELHTHESVLRGHVDIIGFDIHRVKIFEGDHAALKGLLRDLAVLRIDNFRKVDYAFDIPVSLVREIKLPEFVSGERVRVPEAHIPLKASVTAVAAVQKKLWISFRLYEGAVDSLGHQPLAAVAARDTAR
jgi:hypothetical protein